ncbi:MAG: fluoride efflux transporter CrcB [Phototrophicales bacterium]|nr:MAG: fluoride efflux transporter CrcB [Chloroflexota bacterium]
MLPPIREIFLVGFGGFLGANARYILTAWFAVRVEKWFGWMNLPYGTLFVNVTGSFLLALVGAWVVKEGRWAETTRLLVGTGFLGAYTTFSTYANESVGLIHQGEWVNGIGNIILTNGLCVLGVLLGLWFSEQLW